ncbi:hypothetical protein FRC15_007977, partial [Serendipita sp. 397]
ASSSSRAKTQDFISSVGIPSAKSYGSYEELVVDPDVDIVYVATPQSRHYHDVLSVLNARKHVLCEKPFTINAEQAAHLISIAKSHNLFLMEAAWTRFFPHTRKILSILHEDQSIGSPQRLFVDFSILADATSRLHDPNLGGGALLDLGFYPVTWAFLILYKHPKNESTLPQINATMMLTERGVDEFTSITLTFEKLRAVAYLTTSISNTTPKPFSILVQGEKGEVMFSGSPPRPLSYVVKLKGKGPEEHKLDYTGNNGLIWQADECARAIRDGKTECIQSPLEDTLIIAKMLDEVRRQGCLRFPDPLEGLSIDPST